MSADLRHCSDLEEMCAAKDRRIAELEALVWAAFCALDADEVERARELLSDACSKADLPKVTS